MAYSGGTDAMAGFATVLTQGTVYLVVAKWTNVGGTGGGTGTVWAFTEPQYGGWQAGGGAETSMTAYASFALTHTKTTQAVFTNFVQFYAREGSMLATTGTLSATYDEVRFGTSLRDVIAKPPGLAVMFR